MNEEAFQTPNEIDGVLAPFAHENLIGHDNACAHIVQSFKQGKFPGAWLLTGPEGIGKATLAWNIARQLVETNTISTHSNLPQNRLESYQRGAFINVFNITYPADDKGGFKNQISVESIRKLQQALSLASSEGGWRAVIIDPAEGLNTASANALLKLLEEPPEQVVFFLISHAPHKLLPTILSRCQKIRLSELSIEDMKNIWPLVCEATLLDDGQFQIAEGSMRAALTLNEQSFELYERMLKLICKPPLNREKILTLNKLMVQKDRVASLQNARVLFQMLFGRLMRVHLELTEPRNDLEAQTANVLNSENLPKWAQLSQIVQQNFDDALQLNLDVEGTILDVWISIDQLLTKGTL